MALILVVVQKVPITSPISRAARSVQVIATNAALGTNAPTAPSATIPTSKVQAPPAHSVSFFAASAQLRTPVTNAGQTPASRR